MITVGCILKRNNLGRPLTVLQRHLLEAAPRKAQTIKAHLAIFSSAPNLRASFIELPERLLRVHCEAACTSAWRLQRPLVFLVRGESLQVSNMCFRRCHP